MHRALLAALIAFVGICTVGVWYRHGNTLEQALRAADRSTFILSGHLRPSIEAVEATKQEAPARWWIKVTVGFGFVGAAGLALFMGGYFAGRRNRARTAIHTHAAEIDVVLKQEIQEHRHLFETTLDLIFITDRRGNFVRVSPSCRTILGYEPQQMVGHSGAEFIHPADLRPTQSEMRLARQGRALRNFESRYIHKDGSEISLSWSGVWSETEQKHFFIGRDRAELKQREDQLRTQNMLLDAALNNMSQGLVLFDKDRRVVICNRRYLEIYGFTEDQVRAGTPVSFLIQRRLELGLEVDLDGPSYERERVEGPVTASNALHKFADGRTIAYAVRPMPDGGGVATHEDVTEQRRIQARIAHMAHHDALTDLPNRVLLRERLEGALKNTNSVIAVFFLDLDRFKDVNDALGHFVGDQLLKEVALRLRTCIQAKDTVARLGGDEFAIIQVDADQPVAASTLAARIIDSISAPYALTNHRVVIGTSIGISVAPNDTVDVDQLLTNADLALYRAKSDGRGAYRFFERGLDERMQARRNLEMDLRQALVDGAFEIHYQPIVQLESNEVVTFEALLRWNHPDRGRIAPSDFIPLAEETGLIVPIGEWTVRAACAEAATWPGNRKVAINLSPLQFNQINLVEMICSALASSGLSASRLELEVTESALLHNTERTLGTLHQLRAFGVRISMDDFGTGYSSLGNLRNYPFDKIKIDRSFIQELGSDAQSLAIVRAIITLGSSLGMAITAEGVETRDQFDCLKALGATEAQGFYLSRPQPVSEIGDTLNRISRELQVAA